MVMLAKNARLGTYYVEFAAPPRTTEVVYDRAGAAITELTVDMVDWNLLLDTRVLHLTGITPALNGHCFELVLEAVRRAKAREALREVFHHLLQIHLSAAPHRGLGLQRVAIVVSILLQKFDHQVVHRKPDRAALVRVAAE